MGEAAVTILSESGLPTPASLALRTGAKGESI
jgi:hypothetical protein